MVTNNNTLTFWLWADNKYQYLQPFNCVQTNGLYSSFKNKDNN